jgi:putative ABC transport system ATP-binding protein
MRLLPPTEFDRIPKEKKVTSENPMVGLVGVSKGFVKGKETITIFDHLNLVIPRGDFIAVMGPSGSGKTTLLNLLGGIDRADGGEVRIADSRIDGMSEGQLAVGARPTSASSSSSTI